MRYTLAGCSRMRVGEGSSENKEIEKMIKILKKTSKNMSRKRDGQSMKKHKKKHPKKEIQMKKNTHKKCTKIDARKVNGKNGCPAHPMQSAGTNPNKPGEPRGPVRQDKINKTHTDIPQKAT